MKEFKWLEDLTESVLLSLIVWLALASLSHLFKMGGIISASLQLVGIFIFAKALWKWWKRKPTKRIKTKDDNDTGQPTKLQEGEELYAFMVWRRPNRVYIIRFLASVGIILFIVGAYFLINKLQEQKKRESSYNYQQCLNECDDVQITSTQESICKRECVGKYK